jgi:hypothetical protein
MALQIIELTGGAVMPNDFLVAGPDAPAHKPRLRKSRSFTET